MVEPSARTQSVEGIFEFDVVVEPGGYGRVSIWLDKPVGMVEGDSVTGPAPYVVADDDSWHVDQADEFDGR